MSISIHPGRSSRTSGCQLLSRLLITDIMRLRIAFHCAAHTAGHHGVLRTHRTVSATGDRITASPVRAKLAECVPGTGNTAAETMQGTFRLIHRLPGHFLLRCCNLNVFALGTNRQTGHCPTGIHHHAAVTGLRGGCSTTESGASSDQMTWYCWCSS